MSDVLATIKLPEGAISLSPDGQWTVQEDASEHLQTLAELANALTFPYLPFAPWQGRLGALAAHKVAEALQGELALPEEEEEPAGLIY